MRCKGRYCSEEVDKKDLCPACSIGEKVWLKIKKEGEGVGMSLSDKRFNGCEIGVEDNVYGEGDIKEFIKDVKKDCKEKWDIGNFVLADVQDILDKIAGEVLV